MEKINLITPEDREMFDRIDRDCLKMHVLPTPKTFINMKVHDKNGNLTLDMDMPSRSWVRNAYNFMLSNLCGLKSNLGGTTFEAGSVALKTMEGTVRQSENVLRAYSSTQDVWVAPLGSTTRGIIVGTGTATESFDSFSLAELIASGSTSGTLSYAEQSATSLSYDSASKKMTAIQSRVMNNNSGGSISVAEVGIAFLIDFSGSKSLMVSRDLLPTPVPVPNAAQLTVTYTIEMPFPA